MRLASKHTGVRKIAYTDFTGGINYTVPPIALKPNEFVSALNVEFEYSSGVLRVRDGLTKVVDVGSDITRIYKVHTLSHLLIVSGQTLYKYDGVNVTSIGTLSGAEEPVFAEWKTGVVIASGGNLQYYDGTTLTTITNSPVCDFVFVSHGRVVVSKAGEDYLYYSGIGDETNWNFAGTDADALQLEVGYKDGGDIVAVAQLAKDYVVFKSNRRAYRVVGVYPNWAVYEISRDAGVVSKRSLTPIANSIIFLDSSGVRSLDTVVEYGDVKVREVGWKVNTWLSKNITADGRIWHVLPRGQVWVKGQADRFVYIYHYNQKAWTVFEFVGEVLDVTIDGNDVLVAMGSSIYKLDSTANDDDGTPYTAYVAMAPRLAEHDWLLKRVLMSGEGIIIGNATIQISDWCHTFEYGTASDIAYLDDDIAYYDDDPLVVRKSFTIAKRTNYRTSELAPKLTIQSGKMRLLGLILEVTEV